MGNTGGLAESLHEHVRQFHVPGMQHFVGAVSCVGQESRKKQRAKPQKEAMMSAVCAESNVSFGFVACRISASGLALSLEVGLRLNYVQIPDVTAFLD